MSNVSVQVFEEFESLVSEQWLRGIAECALAIAPERASEPLSVVIADDDTVRELNSQHRGLDENTDVLSFSFTHQGEYYGEGEPPSARSEDVDFVMPPGRAAGLGEVVVSYPQAVRQAEAAGHSVERELALLLAHGVLHLLGYDHVEPEEEAIMQAQESKVLARVLESQV
jgi:probable rRNA maturation factor